MTSDDTIAELTSARNALDEHYRACDRSYNGLHNELGIEARKRVSQMIWLLSEIGRLLLSASQAQKILDDLGSQLRSRQISPQEWGERIQSPEFRYSQEIAAQITEPLETLTEAFYWVGFRARNVIRELPNLKSFEAEGVRNIRNKLLEHPGGKDSGILMSSFAWGADVGPVIKAMRYEQQVDIWRDNGLFVNANEFASELRTKAESGVASLGGK